MSGGLSFVASGSKLFDHAVIRAISSLSARADTSMTSSNSMRSAADVRPMRSRALRSAQFTRTASGPIDCGPSRSTPRTPNLLDIDLGGAEVRPVVGRGDGVSGPREQDFVT